MCEHLAGLEKELHELGIPEIYRGQVWTNNCREWVYFDCYLEFESLKKRFKFPEFIIHHLNNDAKSGLEEGFVCTLCHDAIMGIHQGVKNTNNKKIIA
ncbi:MAG: hypothetical protein JXJ04_15470 [Spirochaetales bacterium]|nr:hypothetical protein [Spirochaetales bacterium]